MHTQKYAETGGYNRPYVTTRGVLVCWLWLCCYAQRAGMIHAAMRGELVGSEFRSGSSLALSRRIITVLVFIF